MNQAPVSPAPQGGSSTMKWLLIILVIIIVLGGGYLLWVKYGKGTPTATASPSSVPAEWKTYTNTRVKYSFEYPASGLKLDLDETIKYPSTRSSDSKTEDLVQFTTSNIAYSVEAGVGVSDTTIENWIKNTNVSHANSDLTKYTKITIGGKTAYLFTGEALAYVMNGTNVYIIKAMDGVAPSTNTTDSVYQHFLSTFQLTPVK